MSTFSIILATSHLRSFLIIFIKLSSPLSTTNSPSRMFKFKMPGIEVVTCKIDNSVKCHIKVWDVYLAMRHPLQKFKWFLLKERRACNQPLIPATHSAKCLLGCCVLFCFLIFDSSIICSKCLPFISTSFYNMNLLFSPQTPNCRKVYYLPSYLTDSSICWNTCGSQLKHII